MPRSRLSVFFSFAFLSLCVPLREETISVENIAVETPSRYRHGAGLLGAFFFPIIFVELRRSIVSLSLNEEIAYSSRENSIWDSRTALLLVLVLVYGDFAFFCRIVLRKMAGKVASLCTAV